MMMMRQGQNSAAVYEISQCDQRAMNAYIAKVFGWMFIGLMVTALTTFAILYGINVNDGYNAFADFVFRWQSAVWVVFIVEFAIVIALSARVAKMNPSTARLMYLVYAILNGFTFGLFAVIYAYTVGAGMETLGLAFGITAVSFGIMAVYGLVTKADLTRFGNLLWMGLIGLIIMSVANIFMGNGMVDFLICVVGLVLFLGITAHRTHMIKHHFAQVALSTEDEDENGDIRQSAVASNMAIVGALMLYLAFLNIFMFVLRLLGGGSRR